MYLKTFCFEQEGEQQEEEEETHPPTNSPCSVVTTDA